MKSTFDVQSKILVLKQNQLRTAVLKDLKPLSLIILIFCLSSDGGKTFTFFNYDYKGEFQTVTFEGSEIEKIFYGSFHKVSLSSIYNPVMTMITETIQSFVFRSHFLSGKS